MRSGNSGQDSSGFDQREKAQRESTNLKVEDEARLDHSMPLFHVLETMPFQTNHGHPGEYVGSKLVGANVDEDAVPENSMLSLERRAGKSSVGGPLTRSCLPQETEAEHLRTLAWRPPRRAQRRTAMQRARE